MQARIKNPALLLPDAMAPLQALGGIPYKADVPARTLGLVHLRISQINGCAFCLDLHRTMNKVEETPERLLTTAAWRESPYFTDAERAALALAESITRICDRSDAVPDVVWAEAARHFDERQLAALVLHIAIVNTYNRVNVATRQVAGSYPIKG